MLTGLMLTELGIFGGFTKFTMLGIINGGVILITDGTVMGPKPTGSKHGNTIGGSKSWLFTLLVNTDGKFGNSGIVGTAIFRSIVTCCAKG
jgi:hypothetical protein